MPTFSYRAISITGNATQGQLTAGNEIELAHLLSEMGLELVDAKKRQTSSLLRVWPEKASARELIRVFDLLERMTRAGVPLREALGDARDSTQIALMRDVLSAVFKDIGDGLSLSAAMAKHPRIFGFISVTLVGIGERSGRMEEALSKLRAYLIWSDEMVQRTKKALRYPSFVGLMVLAVTSFMMLFVVPQVVSFLKTNNQELPIITEALIATSGAFSSYWWAIFGVPILLTGLITIARTKSEVWRRQTDRLMLTIPIVGPVSRALALARFMQVLAIMYKAGVPILEAIRTAVPAVSNASLTLAIGAVVERIEAGVPLSRALESTGEFEPTAVRLVQLGEATGELDDMLGRIAEDLNRSADETIQSMIAKIEPGMTLLLGGMMGWIALAVFGPIYDGLSASDF